jgi:hypothetical protein
MLKRSDGTDQRILAQQGFFGGLYAKMDRPLLPDGWEIRGRAAKAKWGREANHAVGLMVVAGVTWPPHSPFLVAVFSLSPAQCAEDPFNPRDTTRSDFKYGAIAGDFCHSSIDLSLSL